MHIVYDGIILELKSQGGIARLYRETIPRICDAAPQAKIELLLANHLNRMLSGHANLRTRPLLSMGYHLRPRRLFGGMRNVVRELMLSTIPHSTTSIWHSTYYTQPKFWRGKEVLTLHDMIHELFSNDFIGKAHEQFRKRKIQQVAAADIVVCISEATQQDVHRIYGTSLEKLRCVHPGYSADLFYRQAQADDEGLHSPNYPPLNKPFILYVGLRRGYKNFSTLLTAYSKWPHRNEVDLVVVGRAWDQDEVIDLQRKKLESHVHLRMGVDDHQLRALYNRAEMFVYPSYYEGFGIPLLEAMACGCPIVASRIPTSQEVAQDYPAYFSPSSVEELQAALTQVLAAGRHDALRQTSANILPKFSWQKTAQGYLDIYRELL